MFANQAIEWIIADAAANDGNFTKDTAMIASCISSPVHRVAVIGCLRRVMECRAAGLDPTKDMDVQYYGQLFDELGIKGLSH